MRLERTKNKNHGEWFRDLDKSTTGAVLHHSKLYFRDYPTKKPVYGIDICIDFIDNNEQFEVLHVEWDGNRVQDFINLKNWFENLVETVDFNVKAKEISKIKDQWHENW